jgi:hypothetical protein
MHSGDVGVSGEELRETFSILVANRGPDEGNILYL